MVGRVAATIGGQPATVEWAGMTWECAGVMQVHLRVPSLPPGNHPLVISVDGRYSAASPIIVGPPR
jgi:uncharacterized protein (TIGR03437 family)